MALVFGKPWPRTLVFCHHQPLQEIAPLFLSYGNSTSLRPLPYPLTMNPLPRNPVTRARTLSLPLTPYPLPLTPPLTPYPLPLTLTPDP